MHVYVFRSIRHSDDLLILGIPCHAGLRNTWHGISTRTKGTAMRGSSRLREEGVFCAAGVLGLFENYITSKSGFRLNCLCNDNIIEAGHN